MRVGLAVVLAAVVWAGCVKACTCEEVPLARVIETSDFIFIAKVIAVRDTVITDSSRMWDPSMKMLPEFIARVRIQKAWKGVPRDTLIEVHTLGNSCGIRFILGRSYLIFGSVDGCGAIAAGICSQSKPTQAARADLRVLGRATMPRATKAR